MAKGYIGNAGSKAYPLSKGWVGIMPPQAGTVEEVELPSGYRQLNYIESSGTQYIDTGFKHNQDSRIVAQLQQPIAPGTQSWLIGARNSSSSASRALVYDPSRKWRVDYNASSTTGTKYPEAEATDMIYFDFNKNVLTFNGGSYQWDALTFQCNYNLVLFARNTAGTIDAFASYRLYACKIYDNAVLVRDFIPCKNASNVAGLYDLINGQFYGSAGAEEFIAGDIVSSIPVAYPLKAGWMGDANGKARKVFGAAGYIWQKYAVNEVTETGYREVAGGSTKKAATSAFYVGSSYTLSQTTGRFSVNHNTKIAKGSTGATNAVGKYYVDTIQTSSGTTTGDTLYLITAAKYAGFGLDLTVTPYTAEAYSTTKQEKGDLLGTVTAADFTAYPLNGIADDGYWYVMLGIPEFTYSGTYVATLATMGGQDYLLLEITGSGTYASTQATSADIWICGGGGGGGRKDREGCGGGYTAQTDNQNFSSITITIGTGGSGADGGKTSISGDLTLSANGGKLPKNGGGAGGSGGAPLGRGQGTTTYLFADSSLALYCGGGGAAGYEADDGGGNTNHYNGGAGGSNGSDGGRDIKTGINSGSTSGGAGGAGGGGVGGNYGSKKNGGDATAYGGGGGGTGNNSSTTYYGGAGYQGVCFIRIPLNPLS